MGSGPRATPTYHDGKLYCLFPLGHFFCLNAADGKSLWEAHALKDTGAEDRSPDRFFWGLSLRRWLRAITSSSTPAAARATRSPRITRTPASWSGRSARRARYGTPITIEFSGRRMVLITAARAILAVDPQSGTIIWRHEFGNPYNCNCATPLWVDNVLYLSSAYATGCAALTLSGEGSTIAPKVKWANQNMQNQFATSIIHDGHMYGTNGTLSGYTLRCIELKTGKIKWSDRGPEKSRLWRRKGICSV